MQVDSTPIPYESKVAIDMGVSLSKGPCCGIRAVVSQRLFLPERRGTLSPEIGSSPPKSLKNFEQKVRLGTENPFRPELRATVFLPGHVQISAPNDPALKAYELT